MTCDKQLVTINKNQPRNKLLFVTFLCCHTYLQLIKKIVSPYVRIIVIYTISGIKAILQDSSVKIADDEGVSPSSSVITRVSCNML
jgi:hypothetical protein